ncbi:MAG: hypothetical protein R3B47_12650 [Bacteroidia bacterium]
MVGVWASHLDPADTVLWDISPAGIGNVQNYPTTLAGLQTFYDYYNGGDNSPGRTLNPRTGMPYAPQMVSRVIIPVCWQSFGPTAQTQRLLPATGLPF